MDFRFDNRGTEVDQGDRPRFTFEQESSVEDLSSVDQQTAPAVVGGRPYTRSEIPRRDVACWEDAAAQVAHDIVRDFTLDVWLRTPQETIGLLNDQIVDLVENYFDRPLYNRNVMESKFTWIARNVLGGWCHETDDTIDNHVAYTLRTLAQKQHDYGHDNIDGGPGKGFGVRGILVRMSDKKARLDNLYRRGVRNALFETIEDTWLDLFGYSIIALMLLNNTFRLPLKADINNDNA